MRRAGFFIFYLLSFTLAGIVNRTIDDSFGDSQTFQLPLYQPAVGAWDDETCQGCSIKPDPSKAFKNTYTAATYNPGLKNVSISMGFEGTAIYVFFILANNQGDGITTITMANFTIDGQIAGSFTRAPDLTSTDILFNQLVFSKTDIPNGIHQLVISTSGVNFDVFVNFDYAIYTHVDGVDASPSSSSSSKASTTFTRIQSSTSKSSSSKASASSTASSAPHNDSKLNSNAKSRMVASIVGGVVGALVLIGAIIGCFFCWKRRTRKRLVDPTWEIAGPVHQDMISGSNMVTVTTPFLASFNPDSSDHNTASEPEANSGNTSLASNQLLSSHSLASLNDVRDTQRDTTPYELPSSSGHSFTVSDAISPTLGSSSTTSREQIRRARQSEIKRRLHVVNQEMNELRSELSTPNTGAGRSEKARTGGDDDEMSRMREQVQDLQSHIELLQSQQESAWAQGLSNDPPPGYTP
ncbi:hypothetical protein BDQ17DRAFT_1309300 [Cyathus striatus]|nr:hypothetical protein BDQ17DRAFT_1309300 [Cyathus striatus]